MRKFYLTTIFIFVIFVFSQWNATTNEAKIWLEEEIRKIINLYKDDNINNVKRLEAIENAINTSFAGNGIARFVVGKVWKDSSKEDRTEFVDLFKEHLYLTIGSLMQNYSSQHFEIIDSRKDKNQNVFLIDMEIEHNDQKTIVTWRVKKAKNKFYIIDLLVADISLVVTKRSEFISMLKKVDNNLKELNLLLEKQNHASYNNLIN